ncbi:MAG: type IV pilus assembly protein PilM [Acidimicrobiia bacterium]|nr:type IV pilus assembly protein PilM [Acidimicrobiia bacterium]
MAQRAVGLDVGTSAVRAVELVLGRDQVTLTRFGQVALAPGAVVGGEVVDAPAVASAIRRLWREAGFRAGTTVLGVGNQRVVVRQADFPAMSDQDLRSALQFQAQDLIPIPVEDAILDFQLVEEFATPDGEMQRILLVAAQRDMVRSLLAAVEGGGLSASMVDLIPFALMRALTDSSLARDLEPTADAIVCVGASITNVVVHQRGVPEFVRMLGVGGDDITKGIANELGVDGDTAEDLKRRAHPDSPDDLESRTAQIVTAHSTLLIEEIRGSLDYYQAQPEASPIGRIVLTGGGSRTIGLLESLEQTLGIAIEEGHPLAGLELAKTGIPEERLIESEPLLSVPVGLALAARPPESGQRRISVLPVEVAAVRTQRRQMVLASAAVGVLVVLLLLVWLARQTQVSDEKDKASRAEQENASLQQQVNGLQSVTALDAELAQRRSLVTNALADDVAWTRLLQEIATVIPNDVALTGFNGSKPASTSGATTPAGGGAGATSSVGTINVNAQGVDFTSAARWLLRVGDLPSLTGVWLPSSSKAAGPSLVTFTSTADLTPAAKSGAERSSQYLGSP